MSDENEAVENEEQAPEQSLEDVLREQFAAATAEDTPDETPAPPAEGREAAEADDALQQLTAPDDWPDDLRERFNGFSDEAARRFLLDSTDTLVGSYRTRAEELSAKAEAFGGLESFKPVVDHYGPMFRQMGISEAEGFARLAEAQRALSDPGTRTQAALQILQSYGIDPRSLAGTEGTEGDDDFTDPAVRQINQRLSGLENGLTAWQREQQQNEQAARQTQLDEQIAAFRDAKGDDGSLTHPHFERLRPVVAGLLYSGKAGDMAAAYNMAIWADPELRGDLVAQEAKALAERERQEAKEKALAARQTATRPKAAGRSAPPDTGQAPDGETLEETLRKVTEEKLAQQ